MFFECYFRVERNFCHVYLYDEGEKTNFGSIFDRAMSVHRFPIDLYTLAIFNSDFFLLPR